MNLFSIGLTDTNNEVRARIEHGCINLSQQGFQVVVDETVKGKYMFLNCHVVEGGVSFRNYEHIKNLLKQCVAECVADFIVEREEKKIIQRTIEQNYQCFARCEREIIYENSLKLLEAGGLLDPCFHYRERRNDILTKITAYLDSHHELIVEGFVNFRLKEYRDKLADLIDKATDDFVLESEHQEFINVLKYFVNVQESKVEEVHIMLADNGSYLIADAQGQRLPCQCLEGCTDGYIDETNYEDVLITALLSIAPYHIILHQTGQASFKTVADTVKNVFEGRVMICSGCELCFDSIHIDSADQ